jgi:outer membrane protein assembly factor BamB
MSSVGRACWAFGKAVTLFVLIAALQSRDADGQVKSAVRRVPKTGASPAATPQNQKLGDFTDAITLPTDRKIRLQLEAARDDYIKRERWAEASKLLQAILNRKEDVFVEVSRKGPDGDERTRWVSARAEANRLLTTMAGNGLPFYEVLYGGEAKAKLAEAKKNGDAQLLAEVAQRFLHTQAGAEATDLLGTYHLDRGRPLIAALCYQRLLERENADQLSALTLYKAVLAFRMAGNRANAGLARTTWEKLAAKVESDGMRIGDYTVSLDQLKEEVEHTSPLETTNLADWPMFRGNASRSDKGEGSAPFLDSRWRISLLDSRLGTHAKDWIETAQKQRPDRTEAIIPAFCPIAAGGKLIYRSYWGVHAVDCRTGELLWNSVALLASLNVLAGDNDYRRQVETWRNLYAQGNNQNLLFENSTVGTLSTDESRVYAVDDLALPPYPSNQMAAPWGGLNGMPISGPLAGLAGRSRLAAFDLESGKLVWELGDPKEDKSELAESYFLGPPLPLGGKLYVLTEKNSELRLVCLEPVKGTVNWSQTLATARDKLLNDVSRRMNAVELAYDQGILVCPTNAGAILGVDLLSRSLVWAFPYREKASEMEPHPGWPRGRPGIGVVPGFNDAQRLNAGWKMTAPVIAEGKVVFTAPDGGAIHCLNLQDGDSLWQAERRDDLYLAGVFDGKVVLVGKNSVRALSLADGKKQLWQVGTGIPSGLGIASGHHYYLPLKKGDRGEVCRIDLDRGQVDARSPSPKSDIPGNLLFYQGNVVSQTVTGVTAYEQVDAKVAQIDALLKKNSHDPMALTDRGEMRLYKGDLDGAIADLRDALANQPQDNVLAKARAKLYATLTDLLQRDFAKGEKYLPEYKELCNVPIPGGATSEERTKLRDEEKHRQAAYLCLLAKGRENQGRFLDAFQAYVDFGQLADDELVPVIGEPAVRARPRVWAQGRIEAMFDRAKPEQRQSLENAVNQRWRELQKDKGTEKLRNFVAMFGTMCSAGRQATLLLAERSMEQNLFLQAELYLDQLRFEEIEPEMAARALEALARLMTRKGLMEDAVHFYRLLRRDHANTVVRDGKTGLQIYNELATDKRFLPYLNDADSPLSGDEIRAEVIMETSHQVNQRQMHPFELYGEQLPFLESSRPYWTAPVGGMAGTWEFKLLDRNDDRVLKKLPGSETRVVWGNTKGRFPCFVQGHFAVVFLGPSVLGLDLASREKLWEKSLVDADNMTFEQPHPHVTVDADGKLYFYDSHGGSRRLGQIGPVTASYVCLRTAEGLTALDPLTGETLWTKSDLSENTGIFGDDQYVYLIETRLDRRAANATALRGRDGGIVDVADFSAAYSEKERVYQGRILAKHKSSSDELTVRIYDVHGGRDLWKKSVPLASLILRSLNPELVGVVEPTGMVTVVSLRTAKEVFHAQVEPVHLDKVNDGLLLEDHDCFYLTLNKPNSQTIATNLGNTMTTDRVNGTIYAFRRDSGKRAWALSVEKQMLLLDRFAELPILILSSNYQEPLPDKPSQYIMRHATFTVSKSTGKRIYMPDPETASIAELNAQFWSLRMDKQSGTIDLISSRLILRHTIRHQKAQMHSARPQVGCGSLNPKGALAAAR